MKTFMTLTLFSTFLLNTSYSNEFIYVDFTEELGAVAMVGEGAVTLYDKLSKIKEQPAEDDTLIGKVKLGEHLVCVRAKDKQTQERIDSCLNLYENIKIGQVSSINGLALDKKVSKKRLAFKSTKLVLRKLKRRTRR